MTERCADLDEFFDGELPADQADTFRDHLATCGRCQRVLDGRMQECVAVRVPATRPKPVPAVEAPVVAPGEAPGLPRDAAPEPPARTWSVGRVIAYASPLAAAAAAFTVWLGHCTEPAFELALAVDRGPASERGQATASRRSIAAHTGDVVRPSVRGERYRAIRVFLEENRLVAACPDGAGCRDAGGALTLELQLAVPGKYVIVGLGSRDPLTVQGATLEQTQVAARRAGIYMQLQRLDVE